MFENREVSWGRVMIRMAVWPLLWLGLLLSVGCLYIGWGKEVAMDWIESAK